MQRFFDIVFSGIALLVLAPLFIPVMLILRLTGEGEVFYAQKRVGKNHEIFGLLKFATMLKNSLKMGEKSITVKNDSRVLPFGKFLRATKLNELPQLINVLKGDMSVIGPRPMLEETFVLYSAEVQKKIKKIKPGLSGVGSVVFRDEESILNNVTGDKEEYYNSNILPYKGRLEVWYINNQSLGLYFGLIFLTIWVIIFPQSKLYKKILKDLPKEL